MLNNNVKSASIFSAKKPPAIDILKILEGAHGIWEGKMQLDEKAFTAASVGGSILNFLTGKGSTGQFAEVMKSATGKSPAGDLLSNLSIIFALHAAIYGLSAKARQYIFAKTGIESSVYKLMTYTFEIEVKGPNVNKTSKFNAVGLLNLLKNATTTSEPTFSVGEIEYTMKQTDFDMIKKLGDQINRNNVLDLALKFIPPAITLGFIEGRAQQSGGAQVGKRPIAPPASRPEKPIINLPPGAGGSTDAPVVRFVPKKKNY